MNENKTSDESEASASHCLTKNIIDLLFSRVIYKVKTKELSNHSMNKHSMPCSNFAQTPVKHPTKHYRTFMPRCELLGKPTCISDFCHQESDADS